MGPCGKIHTCYTYMHQRLQMCDSHVILTFTHEILWIEQAQASNKFLGSKSRTEQNPWDSFFPVIVVDLFTRRCIVLTRYKEKINLCSSQEIFLKVIFNKQRYVLKDLEEVIFMWRFWQNAQGFYCITIKYQLKWWKKNKAAPSIKFSLHFFTEMLFLSISFCLTL